MGGWGKWGHSNVTEWGTGSHGGRVPFNWSLLMLTCLVWQLASVFQLDQEVALCIHNSCMKAQRIKCCVTLRKRDGVILRACARLCVHWHVHMHLCGFCSVYVFACSSSVIAVLPLKQDENKECVCLRGRQKRREREIQRGRESKSASERERDFGLVATSLFHVRRNRS